MAQELLLPQRERGEIMAYAAWRGTIKFGLVSIPISLHSAEATSERLHFKMIDKRNVAPVGYRYVNKANQEEVPRDAIVKGYEYEPGRFVLFSKTDFERANPKKTKSIDIFCFVNAEEVDFIFFQRPYYVAPEKNNTKAYSILREAMLDRGKIAIGKFVLQNKEHLVAIIAKDDYLVLEILRFQHEIKSPKSLEVSSDEANPTKKEIELAAQLIEQMTEKWEPRLYKDEYYNDVLKLVREKIESGRTERLTEEDLEDEETEAASNEADFMALLKKSVAQSSRTTRRATARGATARGRRRGEVLH